MKQYEAVIEVMRANGGYATLGWLYQEALKVPGVVWNTKTPFASIRRIVQVNKEFFKIKPGLWALEEYRDRLPEEFLSKGPEGRSDKAQQHNHTYYQGLLVQIGNLYNLKTHVPNQDKNRLFLGVQPLSQLATQKDMFDFGYSHIVDRARTIDVLWFNDRNMPAKVFEVEHSTDMQNSLIKYVELQDFNVEFYIVSDNSRRNLFENRVTYSAFSSIRSRVKFLSYERVADWHAKTVEWRMVEEEI